MVCRFDMFVLSRSVDNLVIFLRLYVHMNQYETFAHRVRSSWKSQSATPKRSESVPSAFLHLLSGTLCHPASEILLPFRCLNPDSKLTCLRQLSASRISAVFSPRLPPLHLPPQPPHTNPPAWMCFLSVLTVTVVTRVRVRENAGSGRDGGWGEREYICMWDKERGRGRGGRRGGVCVCVCMCVCVCVCVCV